MLFVLQRRLLARRSFVTISGKGEGALRLPLPRAVQRSSPRASSLPWVALAVVVYAMIFAGGFFEKWGLNHALTLRHYVTAFGVEIANGSIALHRRRVELVHDDAHHRAWCRRR